MSHQVTVTLSDREREVLDEVRACLGFRSDEQAVLAALYKLTQWLEPNVDPSLFRLSRKTILKADAAPVEPKTVVDKPDPA